MAPIFLARFEPATMSIGWPDRYEEEWGVRPRIHVDLLASLNGRPMQPLIDPTRDLAAVTLRPGPSDWIIPLRDGPLLTEDRNRPTPDPESTEWASLPLPAVSEPEQ